MWHTFTTALSFLTILHPPCNPQKPITPEGLAASFSFFPAVGLLIGGCSYALAVTLTPHMPKLLLATLLVATTAILTRALHMDGLADLADGLGGGYTRERRLEIMKDSRIGAFGAIALILAILIKASAIESLLAKPSLFPLILAPALSRCAMVFTAFKNTYARPEGGMGKAFLEHVTSREAAIAAATVTAAALALAPVAAAPAYLLATAAVVTLMRRLAARSLGGVTGDVLGAVNEIAEIALLALAAGLAKG